MAKITSTVTVNKNISNIVYRENSSNYVI